jgi:hypothetical protein
MCFLRGVAYEHREDAACWTAIAEAVKSTPTLGARETGHRHTLHASLEPVGAERHLCLLSCDEARQFDSKADRWMIIAQNAGLCAHSLILEYGP